MNCTGCGAALPPGSGFCGACGRPVQHQPPQAYPPQPYPPQGYPPQQGYAPPAPQPPPLFGSLRPYPVVFHLGMTRLTGQLCVAPARLYFICESNKGGLAVALGKGLGGIVGAAIEASGTTTPGQMAGALDEAALYQLAQQHPGSVVMDAQRITQMKDTWLTHAIWFNGDTYAIRCTLDKELKLELGHFCQAYNIKHAGLMPT